MAQKIDANMPQDLDLGSGWTIRVTAVDPSGSLVSNVKVSNMSIVADAPLGAETGGGLAVGPFMLVPGPNA